MNASCDFFYGINVCDSIKKCNFVVRFMQTNLYIRRRRIISALLLTLYLSCLVITITHRHDEAASIRVVCADCDNHVQHHGHIGALDNGHDACLICQALSMPILSVPFTVFFFSNNYFFLPFFDEVKRHTACCVAYKPQRGPPSFQ